MIRHTAIMLVFTFVACYAWRDWFRALCATIVLAAFIEHPDMPKSLLGVPGLNPWNLCLASVILAWLTQRSAERLSFDLPVYVRLMLVVYLAVILVGFIRMVADRRGLETIPISQLFTEQLINCVKWVIPGLLLYDGVRDPVRMRWAMSAILMFYLLIAVQVIRWMPPSAALEGGLERRLQARIEREVGHSSVNTSMMLAGGSWAMLATLPIVRRKWRLLVVAAALLVMYGQALTGGRMGYVTWGAIGLLMCMLRWRRYLLLAPVVPLLLAVALPGAAERMLRGFGAYDVSGEAVVDDRTVTAGRTLVWPLVIQKIGESPLVGYGREGMVLTGLRDQVWYESRQPFAHPHNAYLQWLLDNGVIGFALIVPFYALTFFRAAQLFALARSPWAVAAGGVCLALLTALLGAAMGSQTFYPREEALGLWCAIGLLYRVTQARTVPRAAFAGGAGRPAFAGPRVLVPS